IVRPNGGWTQAPARGGAPMRCAGQKWMDPQRARPAVPLIHVRAFAFGKRLAAVEALVELAVEMAGLKAEHRAKRRHVCGKATVASVNVFAVSNGRVDRAGTDFRDGLGNRRRV